MARLAVAACVVLVATAQLAAAYPSLWAGEAPGCADHPKKKEHGHGAPQADSSITFSVEDSAGKAVKAVCPGQTYTVTLGFPEPRLALLTTDAGKFAKSDSKCPARQVIDRSKQYTASKAQSAEVSIPCGRTSPVTLTVTSAKGEFNNFATAISTLPLDKGCKAC